MTTNILNSDQNTSLNALGYYPDEGVLNLPETAGKPEYLKLYNKYPDEKSLAQAILNKRGGVSDDAEKQKANSYARYIIEQMKEESEPVKKFEDMDLKEKDVNWASLSSEQQHQVMKEVMDGAVGELTNPLLLQARTIAENIKKISSDTSSKEQQIADKEKLLEQQKKLLEDSDKKHQEDLDKTNTDLQKTKAALAEEQKGKITINPNLTYDPEPIKPYKSGMIHKDKLKEGYAIKFLSFQGRRNRKKLNRLIENINAIGKDSEKGVRYIFSMTKLAKGGKLRAALKERLLKRKAAKGGKFGAKELGALFAKQRDAFVEEAGSLLEFEKDTKKFEQIKNKVDRWVQSYAAEQASEFTNIARGKLPLAA